MHKHKHETWDVVANPGVPGALWAGYTFACGLAAAAPRRVRLFTDGVDELARRKLGVNPRTWVQDYGGIEILIGLLADHVIPSSHVVQMYGSPLRDAYSDKLALGSRLRHLTLIEPLGRENLTGPLTSTAESSSLHVHHLQQGDAPSGAGLVKDLRPVAQLRQKWRQDPRCRDATLQSLRLAGKMPDDGEVLFVSLSDPQAWTRWVRALRSLPGHFHVLVRFSDAQDWARVFSSHVHADNVRIHPLPDLTWDQLDEVVWLSDRVVTCDEDLAGRCIRSGCPVVFAQSERIAALMDWYLRDAPAELNANLRTIAQALSSRQEQSPLAACLSWLDAHDASLANHARGVQERAQQACDLADVVSALSGESPLRAGAPLQV